jgi:hypothetical protein
MANDTLTADELGQDYRPPDVVAPQGVAPVAQSVVAPPGVAPISPPAYKSPFLSPDEAANRAQMRRVNYAIQDIPLDQAEKAVTAALKFQAQRGYQRDLAGGMQAVDAFTKWGPTMFGGTATSAAAIGRAAAPTPQRPIIVGGRAFAAPDPKTPGAQLTPLTPEVARSAPRIDPNDPDVQAHKSMLGQIAAQQKKIDSPTTDTPEKRFKEFTQLQMMQSASDQLAAKIRAKSGAPRAQVAPSPIRAPQAAPTTPESKLESAKALRKAHPDWSKKQILDAVNQ